MIDELTEFLERQSKDYLEACLNHHHGFTPSVLAFRGDQQVAAVMCAEDAGSEIISAIALIAADGWAADTLAVTFDSYFSFLPDNPTTGRPWSAGEMDVIAQKFKGRERGWVTDALCVHILNRAGDWRLVNLPYSLAEHSVKWGKPDRFDSNVFTDEVGGEMASLLKRAMTIEPVEVDPENDFKDMPYDHMRIILDCITAQMASVAGGMVALVGPRNPELSAVMSRYMRSMGINADITPPIFTEN